jgi:hypothetical protein
VGTVAEIPTLVKQAVTDQVSHTATDVQQAAKWTTPADTEVVQQTTGR